MGYEIIDAWQKLPRDDARILCEGGFFELKAEMDPTHGVDLGEHVAAFANASGGTIVVGVPERYESPLYDVKGLSVPDAAALHHAFEMSVRDLCRPNAVLHQEQLRIPGTDRVLLVVNVDPSPMLPMGVRGTKKDQKGWSYPLRVGSHTRHLTPEDLPMLMEPRIRRVRLALANIPEAQRGHGQVYVLEKTSPLASLTGDAEQSRGYRYVPHPCRIAAPKADSEIVILILYREAGHEHVAIPLVDVEAVWQLVRGSWALRAAGHLARVRVGTPPLHNDVIDFVPRAP